VVAAGNEEDRRPNHVRAERMRDRPCCVTIQDGTLSNSAGELLETGFDFRGTNYKAHNVNGGYCDAYRDAAGCQPSRDVELIMKWNDA
jgi:hypothetical protein